MEDFLKGISTAEQKGFLQEERMKISKDIVVNKSKMDFFANLAGKKTPIDSKMLNIAAQYKSNLKENREYFVYLSGLIDEL
ncbi:MAG: hypothetical protein ACYDBV_12100 [Nitrospiria bacterium]